MIIKKSQKGFSIIIAVVLIILLALIGSYMATLTIVSSVNTTVSAGTMQAWFAARSGIEWAVQNVISANVCFTAADGNFATNGDGDFSINAGAINNFNITVTCAVDPYTESGPGFYNVYQITSRATRGTPGEIAYVSRQLNVSITNAP